MKHIIILLAFAAYVFCLFGECKPDGEVLGTYNMIDRFGQQQITTTTQTTGQKQPKEQQNQKESTSQDETTTQTHLPSTVLQSSLHRLPTFNMHQYNPTLGRRIGLSTLMMSGVLYGLTMLPALIAVTGMGPLSSIFECYNLFVTRG